MDKIKVASETTKEMKNADWFWRRQVKDGERYMINFIFIMSVLLFKLLIFRIIGFMRLLEFK